MKKALITGVSGQDGSYLAELLLSKNYEVYGLDRRKAVVALDNLVNVFHDSNFHIVDGDMIEESRLISIIREIQPDEVYNLAAQSFVYSSWNNPVYTINVNALGVVRLLEAIRLHSPHSKFYQASSSEMYGNISSGSLNEETKHYPSSPYACSKSFGFEITRNYRESFGIFACNGILFNHESERRGEEFVTRKITKAVAEKYNGSKTVLKLGNLNAMRDWGYSPDYVRAMWMMLQHKKPDDYVVASGVSHSVRDFVNVAFDVVDIKVEWHGKGLNEKGYNKENKELIVSVSKEFFRPVDVEVLNGDSSKIRKILGWKPKVSFEKMISYMVQNDLRRLQEE